MIDVGSILDKLVLPDYTSQDLCSPSNIELVPPPLPIELLDLILEHLFNIYLETFNFDLACDLLLVSNHFRTRQYYLIYGSSDAAAHEKYSRLIKTFGIISNIHDLYITEPKRVGITGVDPSIKLVASKYISPEPWDHDHDLYLVRNGDDRYLYDDYFGIVFSYGETYGETCQVLVTNDEDGKYTVHKIYSPSITIILSDVFDTNSQTPKSLGTNPNFKYFSNLLIRVYGPHTGVSFIVQEDNDIINPFITAGDVIMTL